MANIFKNNMRNNFEMLHCLFLLQFCECPSLKTMNAVHHTYKGFLDLHVERENHCQDFFYSSWNWKDILWTLSSPIKISTFCAHIMCPVDPSMWWFLVVVLGFRSGFLHQGVDIGCLQYGCIRGTSPWSSAYWAGPILYISCSKLSQFSGI